jgi:hypothetical protein
LAKISLTGAEVGNFWKPLEGQLNNHKYTIDSALRLHNFIIDFNEANKKGGKEHDATEERRELGILSDQFAQANPDAAPMMEPVVDAEEEDPPKRNNQQEEDQFGMRRWKGTEERWCGMQYVTSCI